MNKTYDGVILSELKIEQEHLVHKTTQPNEDLILARNAELRKNPDVIQDLGGKGTQSWGRWVASIPIVALAKAVKDGYQVYHKNSKFASDELWRWLKSSEGQKYLVRDKI